MEKLLSEERADLGVEVSIANEVSNGYRIIEFLPSNRRLST